MHAIKKLNIDIHLSNEGEICEFWGDFVFLGEKTIGAFLYNVIQIKITSIVNLSFSIV